METLYFGAQGPDVRLVQSLLRKVGYDPGPPDGIFGLRTLQAVRTFQQNHGLTADGIVGPATWAVLNDILRGFAYHTILPGDTLYAIARAYGTTVDAILTANPGLQPDSLQVARIIVVPYGIDVTFDDIPYTYDLLQRSIEALKMRYPFLQTEIIGQSVMGKNIYSLRLGEGPNAVSFNGSIHANEWITTSFLMRFIENMLKAYARGERMQGYDIRELWNRATMKIVPLVNPDGVDFVLGAIPHQNAYYQAAVNLNRTGRPIPRVWNANILGVDLNLNYPANWEAEKQRELNYGIIGPAPQGYGGESPLSEPETQTMARFTRQNNFRLVIAFHTQGQFIFWDFMGLAPEEGLTIARQFSAINGYTVSANPDYASWAGYKDWFIQDFRRPGYTIELGRGVNPIGLEQLDTIYTQNEGVLLLAAVV